MNYTSTGLGLVLIWFSWWLWKTFANIKKCGPNPNPKGKL